MQTAIIWDEAYAEHDTGSHPEGADRISTIVGYLQAADIWPQLRLVAPRPATEKDILLVHARQHLEMVRRAAAAGGRWLDGDTHVSARSFEIALLAAGGALETIGLWDQGQTSFALVRPPGHHALPDRAMGFCLFNNIAIVAATLLERGLERIAIIDWDVHHGNGTQAMFLDDPRVLFISLHQWPLFPGSGWFSETGLGEGEGFTVNMPLPPGCGDGDYGQAFETLIEPIVDQYRPQAVLVSAGQDAHVDDPLGSMTVTEDGFGAMALRCLELAKRHCDGRLALVLEGGYDRVASAHAVEAILRSLISEQAPAPGEGSAQGAAAVERAVETQRAYWDV